MANLYYSEDLPDTSFEVGNIIEVIGEEAHHAVRVSRLRRGERIAVGNAAGYLAYGEVTSAERERFSLRIDEVERVPQPSMKMILVQALAKGDRDERAVEQATEFGVDVIVPWQAARSVSRWDGSGSTEKAAKGVMKWRRIAREAAKQSMRAWTPEVLAPLTLEQLCELAAQGHAHVLVLHPAGKTALSAWAANQLDDSAHEVYVVVGPEGGLSDEELGALASAGAHVLQLGQTVLRTSSAGSAAIAVLNVATARW